MLTVSETPRPAATMPARDCNATESDCLPADTGRLLDRVWLATGGEEVADFGGRVTMVEPGPYATSFGSSGLKTSEHNPAYDTVRAGYQPAFAALERGTPSARREGRSSRS